MIVYLWDAPPRCGVSGSLERAQALAGTAVAEGSAEGALVEAARLGLSAALEPAYVRIGVAYQASRDGCGAVAWRQADGKP
jgi:hypothetical protein